MRDLLIAFHGGDGKYLVYSQPVLDTPQPDEDDPPSPPSSSPLSDDAEYALQLPDALQHAHPLDPRQQDLILRLCELPTLHRRVLSLLDRLSLVARASVVASSLHAAVRAELTDYYQSLSNLDAWLSRAPSRARLLRLLVWAKQPLRAMVCLLYTSDAADD